MSKYNYQSQPISKIRTGFEMVICHDIFLDPSDMGGPLFDIEGNLIGINIAKATRVEFYSIPYEIILDFYNSDQDRNLIEKSNLPTNIWI